MRRRLHLALPYAGAGVQGVVCKNTTRVGLHIALSPKSTIEPGAADHLIPHQSSSSELAKTILVAVLPSMPSLGPKAP